MSIHCKTKNSFSSPSFAFEQKNYQGLLNEEEQNSTFESSDSSLLFSPLYSNAVAALDSEEEFDEEEDSDFDEEEEEEEEEDEEESDLEEDSQSSN